MRVYILSADGGYLAVAPEVPGAVTEICRTRDEALGSLRRVAARERAAFERLGLPLDVDPAEELVELPPSVPVTEWLVPVTPALLRVAVARMDEIAAEVERFLSELNPPRLDVRPDGGWSIRMVLDHMAIGFELGLLRLERWPLDPGAGQASALEALGARLGALRDERFVVEQFGLNQENGRVRWTPRKVLRVVRALHDAWLAHLAGAGPRPSVPLAHHDEPADDDPIEATELEALLAGGRELLRAAERDRRARAIAASYRYYRDRLVPWPQDARERWRAIREEFRRRLLSLDETGLALVRVAPNGVCSSVRRTFHLGISHVLEHLEQMRHAKEAMRASHVS